MSGTKWTMMGLGTVAAVLLAAATARAGGDPALKCAAAKAQAAGKKAAAKLKCHAKAVGKQVAVDTACLSTAEGKFAAAFTKAESKGGCATTGDAGTIEGLVDTFVAQTVGGIPAGSTKDEAKCAAAKVGATGKKADAKLKCNAKAIGKALPVDAACTGKAESKFDAAFVKAESKGFCVLTGDASVNEARVDSLVQSVVNQLSSSSVTATVNVAFNPQVVSDLAAVEIHVGYPTAKVGIPGSGNTPEVNGRVSNLGDSSNNLQASDSDTDLFLVYGGASASAVPSGPIARITFDPVAGTPLAGDFSCVVSDAFDSLGLSVSDVSCTVTLP